MTSPRNQLSIVITPDTRRFVREVKRASRAAGRAAKLNLNASVKIPRREMTKLRRQMRDVQLQIEATVKVAQAAITSAEQEIAGIDAETDVGLEVSEEQKRSVRRQINGIEGTAQVALDTALAAARLAWVTRPRVAPIVAHVTRESLATAGALLASLSGGNVFRSLATNLKEFTLNLDRTALSLMTNLPKVASASALAVSSLGGVAQSVSSLWAGLSSAAGVALLLPALGAGFAATMWGAVAAAKEMGKQLEGYGERFGAITEAAGQEAWARSGASLVNLLERLLPVLSRGMVEVGGAVGDIVAAFSDAVADSQGLADLARTLSNTAQGLSTAAPGVRSFTEAILKLAGAGSDYLPDIGAWVTRIGDQFANWVTDLTESGRFFEIIDQGVDSIRTLWGMVKDIAGIVSGISSALGVENAGVVGFYALADALSRVNEAVNGEFFQTNMARIMEGVDRAVRGLSDGMSGLASAFEQVSGTLGQGIGDLGEAAGDVLAGILTLLADPSVNKGIQDLVTGVSRGLSSLAGALPTLSPLLSTLGSMLGILAGGLGDSLSSLLTTLSPPLARIVEAITPLVEKLAETLPALIDSFAPGLDKLVGILIRLGEPVGNILLGVLDALPSLGEHFFDLLNFLEPIFENVIGLVSNLFETISPYFSELGEVLAPLLEVGLPLLGDILTKMSENLQPLAEELLPLVVPMFENLAEALLILLEEGLPVLSDILGQLLDAFIPMAQELLPAIAPLMPVIADAFVLLAEAVADMLPYFTELAKDLLPLLIAELEDAAEAWDAMSPYIEKVLSAVVTLVGWLAKMVGWLVQATSALDTGGIGGLWDFITKGGQGNPSDSVWGDPQGGPPAPQGPYQPVQSRDISVLHDLAAANMPGGGGTINIYNPVAEPSSETIRRNAQLISQESF